MLFLTLKINLWHVKISFRNNMMQNEKCLALSTNSVIRRCLWHSCQSSLFDALLWQPGDSVLGSKHKQLRQFSVYYIDIWLWATWTVKMWQTLLIFTFGFNKYFSGQWIVLDHTRLILVSVFKVKQAEWPALFPETLEPVQGFKLLHCYYVAVRRQFFCFIIFRVASLVR